MNKATAPLYCPNPICQTPNLESHKFCQQCRAHLPKRYLWAIGAGAEKYAPGELLGDRYLVKSQQVVLDTKPALPPETPTEISPAIAPYLRLVPYQLHIPQVYGQVQLGSGAALMLLEEAPLDVKRLAAQEGSFTPPLLPALDEVWQHASALRQLNWLWQMAQLWQPLSSEGAASSLLHPAILRAEGPLVRLLEVHLDSQSMATLPQLGQLWSQWVAIARPEIATFLEKLCQQLMQGGLRTAEQLIDELDRALFVCGRYQSRHIQIATQTDKGPSRQRNEDACYPSSGKGMAVQLHATPPQQALAIVCDGIGGHEGGDVASHLAIESIVQRIQPQTLDLDHWNPNARLIELENAVCAANDLISQRNDQERRHDRQRMGTTLVMALGEAHEIYVTHVGDSRVYWITRYGCHQITLDDDVASREVRLGYALYRDALQQPAAGSLVQALGMSNSSTLHPTVQRWILDEDSIFLLCSDGLSENDRVEEVWETEILPILDSKVNLATACQRLIEVGNTRNGHDNVTVALVHCQVSFEEPPELTEALLTLPKGEDRSQSAASREVEPITAPPSSSLKTQLIEPRSSHNVFVLLLGILVLLGLGGVLAYLLFPGVSRRVDPIIGLNPQPSDPVATTSVVPSSSPVPSSPAIALTAGSIIQIQKSTLNASPDGNPSQPVLLLPQPGNPPVASPPSSPAATPTPAQLIPAGGILQVISKQVIPGQGSWVKLRVCSTPSSQGTTALSRADGDLAQAPTLASPTQRATPRLLQPNESGWISEATLAPLVIANPTLLPSQLGECRAPLPAATPTPSASSEPPSS